MKRIIYIMSALILLAVSASEANAQMSKRFFFNGGWQFNGTLNNDVATSYQGYGGYTESGYYVLPCLAVGTFTTFGTNNEYYPKQTYVFEDKSALTTDMSRSLYQMPFGALIRYRFTRSMFQPYISAKIGAEYATQSTYMSTFVTKDDNWGFYISPEIGMTFFPFYEVDFGFQVALYYSYATNKNGGYDLDGINNLGFKLGVAF